MAVAGENGRVYLVETLPPRLTTLTVFPRKDAQMGR
jgi:hypothetical protein